MDNFSPLRYPGGKNKTYQYVKYLVENNNIDTYIEPFCGGAAVALKLLLNNDVKKIMLMILINPFMQCGFQFYIILILL